MLLSWRPRRSTWQFHSHGDGSIMRSLYKVWLFNTKKVNTSEYLLYTYKFLIHKLVTTSVNARCPSPMYFNPCQTWGDYEYFIKDKVKYSLFFWSNFDMTWARWLHPKWVGYMYLRSCPFRVFQVSEISWLHRRLSFSRILFFPDWWFFCSCFCCSWCGLSTWAVWLQLSAWSIKFNDWF